MCQINKSVCQGRCTFLLTGIIHSANRSKLPLTKQFSKNKKVPRKETFFASFRMLTLSLISCISDRFWSIMNALQFTSYEF